MNRCWKKASFPIPGSVDWTQTSKPNITRTINGCHLCFLVKRSCFTCHTFCGTFGKVRSETNPRGHSLFPFANKYTIESLQRRDNKNTLGREREKKSSNRYMRQQSNNLYSLWIFVFTTKCKFSISVLEVKINVYLLIFYVRFYGVFASIFLFLKQSPTIS